MADLDDVDYINDNVQGRVELTPLEKAITETPSFLRLNRIQQLGLASMVFPGATHSRASHCLGALHIMTKIARRLKLAKEDEEKLRVAALLHDIGQYPLSHAIEFVYRKIGDPPTSPKEIFENSEQLEQFGDFSSLLQQAALPSTLDAHAKDKHIGAEVIHSRQDLQDAFGKYNKSREFIEEVVRIMTGTHTDILFKQLMDSDFDCDRLDFVIRDSHLSGVKYGLIDLDYLIENLTICRDPPTSSERVLAVKKRRALHTLEHYLTARYYMYSQIIHHKTVKSLELIAKAIFLELARRGEVFKNYKEVIDSINTNKFLFFDDTYFWQKIFNFYQSAKPNDPLRELVLRLIYKRPLKMVREYMKIYDRERETGLDAEYQNVQTHLLNNYNLSSLCHDAGINRNHVVIEAIPVEFVPIGSKVPLRQLLPDHGQLFESMRSSPRLYNEDTERIELLLDDKSSIIYELSKLELQIVRVYLTTDDENTSAALQRALERRLK